MSFAFRAYGAFLVVGLAACGGNTSGATATGPRTGSSSGSGSGSASGGSGGSGSGGGTSSGSTGSGSGGSSAGSSSGVGDGSSTGSSGGSSSGTASDAGGATDPFGCAFAWGEPSPSGSLSSYAWLQFVTTWVGSEVKADGSIASCGACGWLTNQVAPTNLIPVYYAYFIGFYGHANGFPDANTAGRGQPSLATGAGALIMANRSKIIQMYAYYAQQTHRAWPTKPLVWLLEGDFVQYTATTQTQPLTYQQLGQLAADITTAIKSNMPNAVVAIDHSNWNSDAVTNSFWAAMAQANYDMVWTTGVGNLNGFIPASTTAMSYNGKTATYSYIHTLTGKKILVDESAGASQQSDTWSNQSPAALNALISSGVVAVNVSGPPPSYQANVSALAPQLSSTCP